MFKNLLIVSLRNLRRHKGYNFLNILGLTLAISISMLAILKVDAEFSFEKSFKDYHRIIRINQDIFVSDQHIEAAVTPGAMGPALVETFPEVEMSLRMERGSSSLKYGDKEIALDRIVRCDTSFFSLFGIEVIIGDKSKALLSSESIAISESTAKKIFGNANPLGQPLFYNGTTPVAVSLVYKDLPLNSHIKADALLNLDKHSSAPLDSWYDSSLFTYIKVKDLTNVEALEEKINALMVEKTAEIREQMGWKSDFTLMPIQNIRLHSNRIGDTGGSSIGQIIALLTVSIIVVILAAVNYTNLSVALANRRAYEVGMRKINGSPKYYIVLQFLIESMLLAVIAFIIALPIAELAIEPFGRLTGLPLSFGVLSNLKVTLMFLLFSIGLGVIAGFYPAFVLSSFNPIKVIKKGNGLLGKKTIFRNVLIISQFAAGLSLIIITSIVYQQRQFLVKHAMGFDKENSIAISTRSMTAATDIRVIKSELEKINGIKAVSITSNNPPHDFSASNYIPEGSADNATMLIPRLRGDCDFIRSLGIELLKGREFDCSLPGDSLAVLVNETLVKRMGWDDPIGKRIWKSHDENDIPLSVIGVVKDFHYESMHSAIKPLLIQLDTKNAFMLIVRLEPGNHNATIEGIRNKWKELVGNDELNFTFVSDNYNSLYASEEGMSKGFLLLTAIAICIACLGLVGLAAYSTSLRVKEIGIRKVMGANVFTLLTMIWWSFIKLIIIATLIAWPISYYLANDWLNNFAYRIDINPWIFVGSAIAGIALAITSIGFITYGATKQDPVKSIKYE
ncbi:ABC transporter permease [Perlabentimonas gracilis]|uniref:ABC transporter permease n=1 Tax=Perlabentimonas gracilis TaxID=2715279 RepID=UPI00140DB1E7|nr:ABC transporter permease [Perlabentimonas gracilis]NHB69112.1 FtsX-like permease family protein [Perlabentimonas gracilis]